MAGSSTTESTSGPPNEAAITTDGMPAPTSPPAPRIPPPPGRPPPAPALLRLAAAGAGAPLAFVHRLHPGDRGGVAFLDQARAQPLRRRHLAGPRIAAGGQGGGGGDRGDGPRHAG